MNEIDILKHNIKLSNTAVQDLHQVASHIKKNGYIKRNYEIKGKKIKVGSRKLIINGKEWKLDENEDKLKYCEN